MPKKNLSAQHKRNISLAMAGKKRKPLSPTHRQNIAEALAGIPLSPERVARVVAARKANGGYKVSEETSAKLSKALTGRKLSRMHKKRISEALKGKVVSQETRKKLARSTALQMKQPRRLLALAKARDRKGENHLYVVSFPRLKGLFKVGVSKDIHQRLEMVNAWTKPLGRPTIHLYLLTLRAYECEHIIHMHFKAEGEWVACPQPKLLAYARSVITRMKRRAQGHAPRCGGAPSPTGVSTPTPSPSVGSSRDKDTAVAADVEPLRLAA